MLLIISGFAWADCPTPGTTLMDCLRYQIQFNKLPNSPAIKPLTYYEFQKLATNVLTKSESDQLLDFAYEQGNPILYKDADREILYSEYSLNFLWIHKEKLEEPGHIMGNNDAILRSNVLNPILDWHTKQPLANINFWFDGMMVCHAAIEKTINILKENNIAIDKIRFRNIRELDVVKNYPHLFLASVPVYFRVDLAKVAIGDHVLHHDRLLCSINIDSDIVGVNRRQLFDRKTLNELDKLGYAFGTADSAEEENSFIMLFNDSVLNTLKIHAERVIKPAIEEANLKLKTSAENPSAEAVFDKYKFFKTAMQKAYFERTQKKWKNPYSSPGKYMIFPKSQHGALGGYDEDTTKLLKLALAPAGEYQ